MKLTFRNGRLSCIGCLIALPWLFVVVFLAGCPIGGGGNGNGNQNGNGNGNGNENPGQAQIITPASSFGLSVLDPPFQVRYTVPDNATDITGYRFAVANSSLNSPAIGDRVTIAGNLQAGANRFFDFDPTEAGVGYYRVGVQFTVSGETDTAESTGVIQVQGSPDPIFIFPDQPLTVVEEGNSLTVNFDARDPENQVQWRLYYLASDDSLSAPPDQIGTQLAIGQGNAGTVQFRTDGLLEGDYTLGLSATDSGMSVAATVAAGQLDRIVTIPREGVDTPKVRVVAQGTIVTPTITITNPGAADINLYKDATFTIQFTATVPNEGTTASVEVFYDTDTNPNNGFTLIAGDLTNSDTEVEFPSGVPEGTYFVGATIRDGINAPVTDYGAGQVIVTRTISLTVTEPNITLLVAPGTNVNILWETNAPDDAGTVDVFAQRLNSSNQPTGAAIPIVTAGDMSLRTATFSSTTSGLFQITVRLNITGEAAVTANAPRPVRVSSLPAIAWLGSLAEASPRLDGAIFGGVNFEDNAGSAFAKADDLDEDGLNEFVIAARYGKPFFINPSGVGPGEAYVIYGERGSSRLIGEYSLNSVSTSVLRGITLTGVQTFNHNDNTLGLGDILSIPDADGDGKEELAFGFPFTDSADAGVKLGPDLCTAPSRAAHFARGGVVILSSTNSSLIDPVGNSPVINLDRVGRRFNGGTTPTDINLVLDDLCRFDNTGPDCIQGTDSTLETVIGPFIGFVDALQTPLWITFGQVPGGPFSGPSKCDSTIGAGPPPDCPARTDLQSCSSNSLPHGPPANYGSGFIEAAAPALEPFGARVLGLGPDEGNAALDTCQGDCEFGTTLTVSHPSGPDGAAELVVSSPNRAAGGVAYIFPNTNLWGGSGVRPKPHQYIVDITSYFGDGRSGGAFSDTHLVGDNGDGIENILGINDFNRDGRGDLVVGAPSANGGSGHVYIAYRRVPGSGGLEGDFELSKLALDPSDPQRLDGLLITTDSTDALGFSLAQGFDFNNDGISDIVIGSPDAGNGTGEVIILFGGTGILSPVGGISVHSLLTETRTSTGGPVAIRIQGPVVGGEKGHFGFNIANAGDVDGDGIDDLVIASPDSSPRFDSDPNDAVDQLNTPGIDMDLNGIRDEVPGPDTLDQAGLVYVIFGKNRLDQVRTCQGTTKACTTSADCSANVACTLTDPTINVSELGTSRLQGLIVAGRRAGDHIGGGDAGDINQGGIDSKADKGRSRGLGSAGDVDGDGRDDILIGSVLADPRRDPSTGVGVSNGGEVYLIYGSNVP